MPMSAVQVAIVCDDPCLCTSLIVSMSSTCSSLAFSLSFPFLTESKLQFLSWGGCGPPVSFEKKYLELRMRKGKKERKILFLNFFFLHKGAIEKVIFL